MWKARWETQLQAIDQTQLRDEQTLARLRPEQH
jgi:hypothetical protein